jgi:hypothetical protein
VETKKREFFLRTNSKSFSFSRPDQAVSCVFRVP